MHDPNMNNMPAASPFVDRYLPKADEGFGSPGGGEGTIRLAAIRGIIYRQRSILIGVVAVALVLGLVITLLTKPLYEAAATVEIDPGGNKVAAGLDPELGTVDVSRFMTTQGAVIKSRAMAYRVVDAMKLDTNKDLIGQLATDRPEGASDKDWAEMRRETAAAIVQGGVNVEIPYDSRIVTISYKSDDPRVAAMVANGIVDTYLLEDTRRALEANTMSLRFLTKQITEVRGKLQEAELSTNAFAKTNGIIGEAPATGGADGGNADSSTGASTITAANLFSVNTSYTQARAKRIAAEQRWRAISAVPASQLPEVQQNGVVQGMVSDRAKATTELAQLRQRYGDNFPRIGELKSQIAALDSQITRSSADIKSSIRNDYEIALRQEQGLESELQRASGATMTEQDRRVRYNLLNRDAGALRTQLATLLDRYTQLSSVSQVNSNKSTKLDPAEVPGGPVSPNLFKNMLIAGIAGFGLALVLAILRESFDDRMRSAEDVERKLGYPLLGHTPMVGDQELAEQSIDPFSPLMEAYSSVRTAIDFAYPGSNRVFLITSSEPSEGKSMTSAILGRNYARLGRKTLLVEADLRKPSLSHIFADKRPERGILEVLLGEADLSSVLLPNVHENLDVLPVGKKPVYPVELLSSPVMASFIEKVRQEYAVVIFDTAPVMGLADAPTLSRLVDGTIFIVEANRAHYGQAKTALRRLRSASANVLGVVLTKFRAADAGQDYDYHYRYYTYGDRSSAN